MRTDESIFSPGITIWDTCQFSRWEPSYKPNQLSPHFLEPPNTKGSLLPMLIIDTRHMHHSKPTLILSPHPTCILTICFNCVHKGQNNCLQDFTIEISNLGSCLEFMKPFWWTASATASHWSCAPLDTSSKCQPQGTLWRSGS
jgi:hypothetical protein